MYLSARKSYFFCWDRNVLIFDSCTSIELDRQRMHEQPTRDTKLESNVVHMSSTGFRYMQRWYNLFSPRKVQVTRLGNVFCGSRRCIIRQSVDLLTSSGIWCEYEHSEFYSICHRINIMYMRSIGPILISQSGVRRQERGSY